MDWNDDAVIFVGPVCENAFRFENADGFEKNIAHSYLPPDRALVAKKRLVNACSENRDPAGIAVVIVGNEATLVKAKATHVEIRRGCSDNHRGHREIIRLDDDRAFETGYRS